MEPQPGTLLSVCLIVKNEEGNIGPCLESVKDAADEFVVVDTGSNDATIQIAENAGARVIRSDWRNDFSYSRNISIDNARGAWILWLDADDRVTPDSIAVLNTLKRELPDKVFSMIVRNRKPGNTGTEFMQARMFPRHAAIRFERAVHEQVMPSALRLGMTMVAADVVIEHLGYADPDELRKKAQRNIALLLKELKKNKNDPYLMIELADSYYINGEEDAARIGYEKITAMHAARIRFPLIASQAHYGLGTVFNTAKDYETASGHFRRAAQLCPERTDALYCLAVSRELGGDRAEALRHLRLILDMTHKPVAVGVDYRLTRIKTILRLARLLREENLRAELETLCAQGAAEYTGRPEIQNCAGVSYTYLGKLVDALHCYEKSIGIVKEGNIDAYIGLCVIYIQAGKRDAAEKTMASVFPLFKETPRYWAFREITGISAAGEAARAAVSEDAVNDEKKYLRDTFGIEEIGRGNGA